ncbi:MAG TPA: hypothetical protein VFA94_15420 [Acidimicrobiales bacterium]|nr:hypothetical protein [Acidimicrobiales bacterium]
MSRVDHGTLLLTDTQLLGVQLESGELVIDIFGGSGRWIGFAGDEPKEQGVVQGTPMLTFRAAFEHTVDRTCLEQLRAWTTAAGLVDLTVEVAGDTPLHSPTRVTIRDEYQALALSAAA